MDFTRSEFLKGLSFAAATGALSRDVLTSVQEQPQQSGLTVQDLQTAQKTIGVEFTEDELQQILRSVRSTISDLDEVRTQADDWMLGPACAYQIRFIPPVVENQVKDGIEGQVERPDNDEDLAFMSVAELSHLIQTKKVTSTELTKLALTRLKKYGPKLRCVAALTEERALQEAAAADAETEAGINHGPLHGIPYGVKDLFAADGYPTQWGAAPFKDQEFSFDSAVVEQLKAAGAVLVAKLSLGALAMGDNWYEGRTESPWNPRIGSSGSSAGSASAVSAGLVPFAIGTETSGSLVSPAHNCRVMTVRPTFGSISRFGAMPLSWSLDKVGPLCRTATDCALVFSALHKKDSRDYSTIDRNFAFTGKADPSKLSIGYLVTNENDLEKEVDPTGKPHLEALVEMGATLMPCYLPPAPDGLGVILSAECAAAFESYTRSERIQDHKSNSWPQIFRAARFVSAVDYIQADRVRNTLAYAYEDALWRFDAVIADDRLYPRVYALNCTGHPQVLVPLPMGENNQPRSCSIIGAAFSEGTLLALGQTLHEHFKVNQERPDMTQWE